MAADRQQALRIIVAALSAGQLAFLAVVLVIQRSVAPPEGFDLTTLPFVAVIVLIGAVTASFQVGRSLVATAARRSDELAKWTAYQTAVIVRLAILEGASFLTIVFYLLSGEWLFLVLFVASFGAFLFQRPKDEEWEGVRSGS